MVLVRATPRSSLFGRLKEWYFSYHGVGAQDLQRVRTLREKANADLEKAQRDAARIAEARDRLQVEFLSAALAHLRNADALLEARNKAGVSAFDRVAQVTTDQAVAKFAKDSDALARDVANRLGLELPPPKSSNGSPAPSDSEKR
eukprot:TRINITY_DN10559_c0_g1_i1.p1 TRINITY_DN10559_c0_g1~~TRINITY_DN10559_c0_g1_i1.p1  ORF type:complete len:153 (+),score=26.04 TRINITY_DN10559_c0_g1_i1:25-459(+)